MEKQIKKGHFLPSICRGLHYFMEKEPWWGIPASVTSIGDRAFLGCGSLSEIVIPSSVTSIGKGAFSCCDSLSEIVIPFSVTSIGDSAFYDCKFPDNLEQELISRFGDKIFSLW